jgi:hypothetical protein
LHWLPVDIAEEMALLVYKGREYEELKKRLHHTYSCSHGEKLNSLFELF